MLQFPIQRVKVAVPVGNYVNIHGWAEDGSDSRKQAFHALKKPKEYYVFWFDSWQIFVGLCPLRGL